MTKRTTITTAIAGVAGALALLAAPAADAQAGEVPSGHRSIPLTEGVLHPDVLGDPSLELHCNEYAQLSVWIDGTTGPSPLLNDAGLATVCVLLFGGIPF